MTLRTNSEVLTLDEYPASVFLPDALDRQIDLRSDTRALFDAIRSGTKTSRTSLTTEEDELVRVLMANALVFDDETPGGSSSEHVAAYALAGGGVAPRVIKPGTYGYLELVGAAGIDVPLPASVQRAFECADQRGDLLEVIRAPLGLAKQWNPYAGRSYLEMDLGRLDVGAHRWFEARWDTVVRTLNQALHESVHQHVASLGLRGLLRAAYPAGLLEFHSFSEWLAGMVTDVEAGFELSLALGERWPPATQRSHVVTGQARDALEAIGLNTPDARGRMLYEVWRDGRVSGVTRPSRKWEAVLANYLLEEWSYAKKVQLAEHAWQRSYWFSDEIRQFIEELVPARPVTVATLSGRIVLSNIEDLVRHWREVGLDLVPEENKDAIRAVVSVRQLGLKVAELTRAARSPRFQASEDVKRATLDRLSAEWTTLKALAGPAEADLSGPAGVEIVDRVHARRAELTRDLRRIAGGSSWSFAHPLLHEPVMLKDGTHGTNMMSLGTEGLREAEDVKIVLAHVLEECEAFLVFASDPVVSETRSAAQRLAQAFATGASEADVQETRGWLLSLRGTDRIKLRYDLDWIVTRPFIEPLNGFRVT